MTQHGDVARVVLPLPDRAYQGDITYDAEDPESKFPPIEPLRPPGGAPNVIIALIDDCGFGGSSAFGRPCHTPRPSGPLAAASRTAASTRRRSAHPRARCC